MHFVKAKGILSHKNGINLYRGCSHGCIYCDSRSSCYRMEHDFEDIEIKENAVELLERALKSKKSKCMIGTGSMTDPYIPLEEEIRSVRAALELILKYGFGFTLITKSDRVLRDIDLLGAINAKTKCVVQMTLTTFDDSLCEKIEPNVNVTSKRIAALKKLHSAGIPTVVWLCPILPYINDTEENIKNIIASCAEAGVYGIICFGMGVTLRDGNREYFYKQLDRLFPGLKERYIHEYGNRYSLESPRGSALMKIFHNMCSTLGLAHNNKQIFEYIEKFKTKNDGAQLSFFD